MSEKKNLHAITTLDAEAVVARLRAVDPTAVVAEAQDITFPADVLHRILVLPADREMPVSVGVLLRELETEREARCGWTNRAETLGSTLSDVFDAVKRLIDANGIEESDEAVQELIALGMPNPFSRDVTVTLTVTTTIECTVQKVPCSVSDDEIGERVIDSMEFSADATLSNVEFHIGDGDWETCSAEIDSVDSDDWEATVY